MSEAQTTQRLSQATDQMVANCTTRIQEFQEQLDQSVKGWSSYLEERLKQQQTLLETLTQHGKNRWETLLAAAPRTFEGPGSNGKGLPEAGNLLGRLAEQDQALYQELLRGLGSAQESQLSLVNTLANVGIAGVQSNQKFVEGLAQVGQAFLGAWQDVATGSFATSEARAAKVHVKA